MNKCVCNRYDEDNDTDMEAGLNRTMYAAAKLPLNIIGVYTLSKIEVRRDILDIEKTLSNGSDSDSSIISKDVPLSPYPVKPRKLGKGASKGTGYAVGSPVAGKNDTKAAAELIRFIKSVRSNHHDLYEQEVEREKYEQRQVAYDSNLSKTMTEFLQLKKEQENYFHMLQSLYIRSLQLYSTQSRQNVMIGDMLGALRGSKVAVKVIESYCSKVHQCTSALASMKKEKQMVEAIAASGLSRGIVDVLHIHIKLQEPKDIVIYKGQIVNTPYGIGTIVCINSIEKKVEVRLPWGVMYSTIASLLRWSTNGDDLDVNSDRCISKRWKLLSQRISPDAPHSLLTDTVAQDDDNHEEEDDDDDDEDTEEDEERRHTSNSNYNSVYPVIVPSYDSVYNVRKNILNRIRQDSLKQPISLQLLPLAFCPPSSLPRVTDSILTQGANRKVCTQALKPMTYHKRNGVDAQSLAWSSDVHELHAGLKDIKSDLYSLEQEQQNIIDTIESHRMRSSKLLQDTTNVRLSMYTRRIRHIIFLNNKGLQQLQENASELTQESQQHMDDQLHNRKRSNKDITSSQQDQTVSNSQEDTVGIGETKAGPNSKKRRK